MHSETMVRYENATHPDGQPLSRGHVQVGYVDPEIAAKEAARMAAREANSHSPAHNTASPLAVAQNGNLPAGWASADVAAAAERERVRQEVMQEQTEAANAAVESEIDRRLAESRGAYTAAGVHVLTETTTEVTNVE